MFIPEVVREGANILKTGLGLIDKIIPDQKANLEAKENLFTQYQAGALQELDAKAKVITAEAQSESWIAKSWRPLIAYQIGTLVCIILFNNGILVPYLGAAGIHVVPLPLDKNVWDSLMLCLGGYMGLRSYEKTIPQIIDMVMSKWKR